MHLLAALMSFSIIIVHPMAPETALFGPNHDWAPLQAEYSHCRESATSYFSYTACTVGAYDRAIHPTVKA